MAIMQISQVSSTGNNAIDSLLWGVRWQDQTISYSFPTAGSTFVPDYSTAAEPWSRFSTLTTSMRQGARQALSIWSAVANVTFSEVTEPTASGVIRFGQSSAPSTAWSYYPYYDESGGDIWFGYQYDYTSPHWQTYSDYAFFSTLHEIGHSLGLKHPGYYSSSDTPPYADVSIDAYQYSVMSYYSYPGASMNTFPGSTSYPQTPMLDDVAAVQYIYGANYTYNAGNTTYSFSPADTKIFQTIWDGGGIDTYDASAYTQNVTLQLEPGYWSTLGASQLADLGNNVKAPGSVANAYLYQNDVRSLIENAIGGSGDDTLRGGPGNNSLTGGNGADQLWGGSGGNDTLLGGVGDDGYWWGSGDASDVVASDSSMAGDVLRLYNLQRGSYAGWNQGGDLMLQANDGSTLDVKDWYTQDDATRIQSFVFADLAAYAWNNGKTAIVNLYGNVYGNGVHKAVAADSSMCILRGTSGADTLIGGAGTDQLWGGAGGNDELTGGAGSDTYWFTADQGKDTVTAAADNSEDVVRFATVWQPSDLTLSVAGSDLYLTAGATQIVLVGWGRGGGMQLNRFYFEQTSDVYQVQVSPTGSAQFVRAT